VVHNDSKGDVCTCECWVKCLGLSMAPLPLWLFLAINDTLNMTWTWTVHAKYRIHTTVTLTLSIQYMHLLTPPTLLILAETGRDYEGPQTISAIPSRPCNTITPLPGSMAASWVLSLCVWSARSITHMNLKLSRGGFDARLSPDAWSFR
jgi:hypothetical protein